LKRKFINIKEKNSFLFFIILIIIFIIAFDPSHQIEKTFLPANDKIKHILAFFVISYLFIENSLKIKNKLKIFILIFIAIFIEFIQSIIGREASIFDFVSSLIGIVSFISIKKLFFNCALK
jgi:VanZ family protein